MGAGGFGGNSSENSDEEEDEEIFVKGAAVAEEVIDDEEILNQREEELRAELNFATHRCQELQRTLQETKSFIKPTPSIGIAAGGAHPGRPTAATIHSVASDDEYDDAFEESTEFEVF